ncbi:hypothetical protein V1504DRAFT_436901 [Lipomyces starkeyi]
MLNNFPEEYGGAITSLGSISNTPIRLIGSKLSELLWGIKGLNQENYSNKVTAYAVNGDDSGASYHYCNDITQMFDLRTDSRVVEVANGAEVKIEGIGSVKIILKDAERNTSPFMLREVRYSPNFSMSLLSISRATDTCNDEVEVAFRKLDAYLRIEGTQEEFHMGRKEDEMRLYELSGNVTLFVAFQVARAWRHTGKMREKGHGTW